MCGECHGLDALGYRGPNLIAYVSGASDEALFQTIRKGVPGSEMPASTRPDHEVLQIMAYLRNMGAVAPAPTMPAGNVANGEQLYTKQCQNCHRVAGKGGRLGPILSRIGSARTQDALVREFATRTRLFRPRTRRSPLSARRTGRRFAGSRRTKMRSRSGDGYARTYSRL
jgi:mono/diheme cytochrome c family protein